MLKRVNTYLERIPLWRSLRSQSRGSSHGLCGICLSPNDAGIIYTPHTKGKIDLALFKKISFVKNTDLTEPLSQFVKNYNLEGVSCNWVLDPAHYQLMLLEDLPVEANEFQQAVRWKIKGILPYPVEDAVIDSFPLPIQKTFRPQKMIMIVVARMSYLQPVIDQMELVGLNIQTIDIPELALRNITALFETDEMSSALIYVQKKHVDLVITYQKTLYLARRINFDSTLLDMNETQQIEKLALEIQRSFDFYQSQWRIAAPTNILFATAKTNRVDVAEALSTYLTTSVKKLDLNSVIMNSARLDSELQNRFLPVIGSLLREEINEHATTN